MKLMVYGTLQSGHGNNRLLYGAEFLGPAITNKPYVLFHCGFPKAVPFSIDPEKYPLLPVIGEVYEVDGSQLARCDMLEGHPSWYRREPIYARLNGAVEEVHIYEMKEWQERAPLCNIIDNKYYRWAR